MFILIPVLIFLQNPSKKPDEQKNVDVTQKRILDLSNGVNDGMKTIQRLGTYLKSIGDLSLRQAGETIDEYRKRVENGTKAQALYLIDLRNEYERVLQTNFELRQSLSECENEISKRNKERDSRITDEKRTIETLKREIDQDAVAVILIKKRVGEFLIICNRDQKNDINEYEDLLNKFKKYASIKVETFFDDKKDLKAAMPSAKTKYKRLLEDIPMTPKNVQEIVKEITQIIDLRNERKNELDLKGNALLRLQNLYKAEKESQVSSASPINLKELDEKTQKIEMQAITVALYSKIVAQTLNDLDRLGDPLPGKIANLQAKLAVDSAQLDNYLSVLLGSVPNNPIRTLGSKDVLDDIESDK
jgi:hypothetical protein